MGFLKEFFNRYKVLILLLLLFIIIIVINSDKIEGFINKPPRMSGTTIVDHTHPIGNAVKEGDSIEVTLPDGGTINYKITYSDYQHIRMHATGREDAVLDADGMTNNTWTFTVAFPQSFYIDFNRDNLTEEDLIKWYIDTDFNNIIDIKPILVSSHKFSKIYEIVLDIVII